MKNSVAIFQPLMLEADRLYCKAHYMFETLAFRIEEMYLKFSEPSDYADDDEKSHEELVWAGEWQFDYDGVYEAKPFVVKEGNSYYPGIEVSYMGGDSGDPGHSCIAHQTLEEAKDSANDLLYKCLFADDELEEAA